jgi:hypothetical protein
MGQGVFQTIHQVFDELPDVVFGADVLELNKSFHDLLNRDARPAAARAIGREDGAGTARVGVVDAGTRDEHRLPWSHGTGAFLRIRFGEALNGRGSLQVARDQAHQAGHREDSPPPISPVLS